MTSKQKIFVSFGKTKATPTNQTRHSDVRAIRICLQLLSVLRPAFPDFRGPQKRLGCPSPIRPCHSKRPRLVLIRVPPQRQLAIRLLDRLRRGVGLQPQHLTHVTENRVPEMYGRHLNYVCTKGKIGASQVRGWVPFGFLSTKTTKRDSQHPY